MVKWLNFDKQVIFRDKSRDGLFVNFIKDFEAEFGEKVIVGCPKCLAKCYDKFIKKYTMSEEKNTHGYVLKAKYNGIKSKTNGSPCRNADLTIEQAIDLLENHPHGVSLFESIPEKEIEVIKEEVIVEAKKVGKRKNKK